MTIGGGYDLQTGSIMNMKIGNDLNIDASPQIYQNSGRANPATAVAAIKALIHGMTPHFHAYI